MIKSLLGILVLIAIMLVATWAWACTTRTYIINGQVITCIICPYTTTCN